MQSKIINDRYEILSPLGTGGMAIVYLVEDQKLQRKVALKTIKGDSKGELEFSRRFQREAKVCASVDHPNIIPILDYGEMEDGTLFYTMEYCPYPDLDLVLEENGPLGREKTIAIVRQLARGLGACHDLGIYHRDIKAANVLLKDDKTPILADFGLVFTEECTRFTESGAIVGTPIYLPPECLRSDYVDLRSDIYQLGLLFHFLLTGKNLLGKCNSLQEFFMELAAEDFDPPSLIGPEIDGPLRAILSKCVARDMDVRYQSMGELEEALDKLGDGEKSFAEGAHTAIKVAKPKLKAQAKKKEANKGIKTKRKAVPKSSSVTSRTLAYLLVAIFVTVAISFIGWSEKKKRYQISDLKVVEQDETLVFTWHSDHAFPSRIEVRGNDFHILSPINGVLTKKHKIVVADVPKGQSYTYYVVYPDGSRSLAQRFKTSGAPSLDKTKESFRLALQDFLAKPNSGRGKALIDLARRIPPDVVVHFVMPEVQKLKGLLDNDGLSFSERFTRSATVYINLYEAVGKSIEGCRRTDENLFCNFLDCSLDFLMSFRYLEDDHKIVGKTDEDFRVTTVGYSGRHKFITLVRKLDELYSNSFKKLKWRPLGFELLASFFMFHNYVTNESLQLAEDVLKKVGERKLNEWSRAIVLANCYRTIIRVHYRREKSKPLFEASQKLTAHTKTFPADWATDKYFSITWSVLVGHARTIRRLRKCDDFSHEMVNDYCVSLVREYKDKPLVEELESSFNAFKRMDKELQVDLAERMNAILQ